MQPGDIIDLCSGAILWEGKMGRLKVCKTGLAVKLNDLVETNNVETTE
jgi:hypothetical protein